MPSWDRPLCWRFSVQHEIAIIYTYYIILVVDAAVELQAPHGAMRVYCFMRRRRLHQRAAFRSEPRPIHSTLVDCNSTNADFFHLSTKSLPCHLSQVAGSKGDEFHLEFCFRTRPLHHRQQILPNKPSLF